MELAVPNSNDFESIGRFLIELDRNAEEPELIFDFGKVSFCTPAWLVLVGGGLRQLRSKNPLSRRKAINFKHLRYAGHMGFFEYFGLRFGLGPDEARGSDTYIPLNVRECA